MLTGLISQALSMLLSSIYVHDGSQAVSYISVLCLLTLHTFFSLGWLIIPRLYTPGVCTLRIWQKGAAAASAAFSICNFIVVEITSIAIQHIR